MRTGPSEYLKARSNLIRQITFAADLTTAEKLVAIAVVATADEDWRCDLGQAGLAVLTGISRLTVNKSINPIEAAGYFRYVATMPGEPIGLVINPTAVKAESGVKRGANPGVNQRVNSGVNSEAQKSANDGHFSQQHNEHKGPNYHKGLNSVSLRDTDRIGGCGRRDLPSAVPFANEYTLSRWHDIYDLLTGDYGKTNREGEATQTMGGIVRLSEWIETNIDQTEVAYFQRVGFLTRDGKWFTITPLGEVAYSHGYVVQSEGKAA